MSQWKRLFFEKKIGKFCRFVLSKLFLTFLGFWFLSNYYGISKIPSVAFYLILSIKLVYKSQ